MSKLEKQKQEVKQEWIEFAKNSFYHKQFPEHQHYSTITDEQWDIFGHVMSYISEDWDDPTPSGTEERQWYRAYAAIITGGRKYCKKVANRVIDGKSMFFSNDYHILRMIPFLDIMQK